MTAEEIRDVQQALIGSKPLAERVANDKYLDVLQPMIGLEIAAQLAELNQNVKDAAKQVDDRSLFGQVFGK